MKACYTFSPDERYENDLPCEYRLITERICLLPTTDVYHSTITGLLFVSRRTQRSAFDQVFEFDRGRILAYRGCGLSFRKIGSRVGRNQTTAMRICDHLMQEGKTDRRGRSHSPQCTTSLKDRHIVRMAVTDRSVTSRTVAQHIESVMHHSVSARTIRRRLQQSGVSARRPLLGLPLTQNHRRLFRQWCYERRIWRQNGMKLSLLTSHASVCNTTMVIFESGGTVERGS
ncbi:transposable element Tcb1 transposase [Trichonephila clavipes]|nr:transposable element Tcb1 transposase [Trichonephila clavipes]